MIWFLLASVGLIILCVLILAPGLFRPKPMVHVDMDRENLAIARERWSEVDHDQHPDHTDSAELEAALLSDLSGPDYNLPESSERGRWSAMFVLLLVPLTAALIYTQIGDTRWSATLPDGSFGERLPEDVDIPALLMRLEQSLAENPDNADGWAIAGRTYMVMSQFAKAEAAYAKVHALVGDDPDILTVWADASLMNNGGRYTPSIAARIERALELDPLQINALWIGSIGSVSTGDQAAAEEYLERLRPLLADNPEARSQLEEQLGDFPFSGSSERTESTFSDTNPVTNSRSLESVSISLEVSIAPEQLPGLPPDATVFVFARPVGDSGMPLVARKIFVEDLPQTISLQSGDAMVEGHSLSGHDRVVVTARVSLSDTPYAQSGDLTSQSMEVNTRDGTAVPLVIDRRVP